MTKLVTILARELVEWPEGFNDVGQTSIGVLHLPGIGDHVRHTKDKYTQTDDWLSAIITREMWQAERERLEDEEDAAVVRERKGEPTVPVWLGEGLPPVGIICENKDHSCGIWGKVRIVAHHIDPGWAIFTEELKEGGALYYGQAGDFRPIKSDRDRWIEAAFDIANSGECRASLHGIVGIYDAMKSGKLAVPEVE